MLNNQPIGFFDSGVGGLSIVKEVKRVLPFENIIFVADQKNLPYGLKSKKELNLICKNITEFLMAKNIKALVVACNTASCYSLEYLRSKFNLPIIGIVPAIKPAALKTKKSKIVILSTPATATSDYLDKLIAKFAKNIEVLKIPCLGLEEAIESLDNKKTTDLIKKYSKKINAFQADVVVLGCTHYPIVKDKISQILGPQIQVVDSTQSIAKRIKAVLLKNQSQSHRVLEDLFFTTADPVMFSSVSSAILGSPIKAQKIVI